MNPGHSTGVSNSISPRATLGNENRKVQIQKQFGQHHAQLILVLSYLSEDKIRDRLQGRDLQYAC